jgi:hypothetical protein
VKNVEFLLVTCCREDSRAHILNEVVTNLKSQFPECASQVTVFDNASTVSGVRELLISNFDNVFSSDKNVGYWSAIHWWLNHVKDSDSKYTYIIESDLIHYGFQSLWSCVEFLDKNDDVGSVRLHEYSIANRHLYNKDVPHKNSRRTLWLSHINKMTNKPVEIEETTSNLIYKTTFLTQLPALNRFSAMKIAFDVLQHMPHFSEIDFQRLYWEQYKKTAIFDGGIFNCDLTAYGRKVITSSWTPANELTMLGYQTTRFASITPLEQYVVTQIR